MTAELKNRPRSRVLAIDESTITLQTRPRKIVARKGSKPVMPINDNRKGVSVIGGITGTGRLIVTTFSGRLTKHVVKGFLKRVKQRLGRGRVDVILDNHFAHAAGEVKAFAWRKGLHLHYQPPYSPEVNAAEEIWRQLREFLRARVFLTISELHAAIEEFFARHPRLDIDIFNYLD